MSLWDDLGLNEKMLTVLDVSSHVEDHHFGRPFLTGYQVAMRFKELFPDDFAKIGKPIGGEGVGSRDSLAQYLALELSRNIKSGNLKGVEGGFLSRAYLHNLAYQFEAEALTSSAGQSYDLSVFRLAE
ncbi:hypothetical protein [Shewanella marisflavi]|uniref:hypothetical protein n=1 Tax=Shewanella marisflavi TaxID=260364 RepID=UPI003AAE84DC